MRVKVTRCENGQSSRASYSPLHIHTNTERCLPLAKNRNKNTAVVSIKDGLLWKCTYQEFIYERTVGYKQSRDLNAIKFH